MSTTTRPSITAEVTPDEQAGLREEGEHAEVFVYGTLRVGHYNYQHYRECVSEEFVGCDTRGHLYTLGPFPTIDVLQQGTVHGDVLRCETGRRLGSMIDMEVGAGYRLMRTAVTFPDGSTRMAYVFQGDTNLSHPRRQRIDSGDWNLWVRERDRW